MVYEILRKLETLASLEARTQDLPDRTDFLTRDGVPFNITVGDAVQWSHQTLPGTVVRVSDTHFCVDFNGDIRTYDGRQFTAEKNAKRTQTLALVHTGEAVEYWPPAEPASDATVTVDQAVEIINSIVYLPDWRIVAHSYTGRFQDGILVNVNYQARNSNREEAPAYAHMVPGGIHVKAVIQVTGLRTRADVAHKLITDVIMPIWEHETREFVRFPDSLDAPFHPHNTATMKAWGSPLVDIKFGAA